jgi:hypothetical protein
LLIFKVGAYDLATEAVERVANFGCWKTFEAGVVGLGVSGAPEGAAIEA